MRISRKILAIFLSSIIMFNTLEISAEATATDISTSDAVINTTEISDNNDVLDNNDIPDSNNISDVNNTPDNNNISDVNNIPDNSDISDSNDVSDNNASSDSNNISDNNDSSDSNNISDNNNSSDNNDISEPNNVPDNAETSDIITEQADNQKASQPTSVATEAFWLDLTQYTLAAGRTLTLNAFTTSGPAPYVTWNSSAKDIASVNSSGVVTAHKRGTAVITAGTTINGTPYEASCAITVYNTMAFSKSSYTLNAGKTQQLSLITKPAAAAGSITYTSSNPSVATVSSRGLVTAVSGGSTGSSKAVITAVWDNLKSSCTITVKNKISLNKKSYTIYTGTKKSYSLKAAATPKGKITWKSSNKKIATVNSKGKITPKKPGKVTITASCRGVSASCRVTVKKPSLSLSSKKTVYLKNPVTLKAKATPSNKIKWKSSNKKIATVSSKGKVTPKKSGKVTIYASCNGITKKCKVTVKKPSISASTDSICILTENGYQLSATSRATKNIKWKSSNKKVATVNKNGYVTGKKAGTAVITAYIPGAKTTIKVTVLKNNYKLNFTKRTMVTGGSTYLHMKSAGNSVSVHFSTDNYDVIGLSNSGNRCKITAYSAGTANVTASFYTYIDGHYVSGSRTCKIVVSESGIKQQQISIARKSTKQLTLENTEKSGVSIQRITWSSSNPSVAQVTAKGLVTAKKSGSCKIRACITYTNGTTRTFSTNIKVSDPKLKTSYLVVAAGSTLPIELRGTNSYSSITWKSSKTSLVSVSADGFVTAAYGKTGKATITIKADGKTLKQKVIVTNPTLKEDYTVLAPKNKTKISLKKINSRSKISYKSSNSSVASVSKKGTVTAKKCGNATITVKADGKEFTFMVNVAPQAAINARNTGYSIINSSTYSQALRMSPGYYDCSSLVFRSYGCNAALLGGSPSWAPTAANMAAHMERTGKVISYGPVDPSVLRPGDLIFYTGGPNGRYRNIYHVSMYYGGGYRLEKPLRYYYPFYNVVMVARPIP